MVLTGAHNLLYMVWERVDDEKNLTKNGPLGLGPTHDFSPFAISPVNTLLHIVQEPCDP